GSVVEHRVNLDDDDDGGPHLHPHQEVAEDAEERVAEVALRARHSRGVEEEAERLAVALLLRDEQPDDIDEARVADPRGVLVRCAHRPRAVGGFAKLPGAERIDDLRQFLRSHARARLPRYWK